MIMKDKEALGVNSNIWNTSGNIALHMNDADTLSKINLFSDYIEA